MIAVLLVVVVGVLTVISLILKHLDGRRYLQIPAAPRRLPFIGNAFNMDMSQAHLVLTELAQQLGPIFRIRIFKEEIVVLNDYDTITEALVTNGRDFAGRPPMARTEEAGRSSQSIVWQTYTPKLVFLRKEVHKCLKMYGSGFETLEEKSAPEIAHLVDVIEQTEGQSFDPWNSVYDAVSCIMLSLILGTSNKLSVPCRRKLQEINFLFNTTFGSGSARWMDLLPWAKFFRFEEHQKLQEALKLRDDFWTNEIILQGIYQGVVRRMLFFAESKGESEYDISENTAKEVFTNLILAGTDTTATSLTCLLLFLLHHPDVQTKLHTELMEVVGPGRLANLSDKQNMPYTQATLWELLRIIGHVPLSVPHYTLSDTSIQGKHVPANTTVYINLWALLHDATFWESPWEFRPERFLDSTHRLLPPSHPSRRRMLAFGAGRRVCLGEAMAKNRLFLFVTALIQNFQFEPVEGESLPDADPRTFEMGLVLHPHKFKLCAKSRRSSPL
ncbi:steroid 17-alpha-hydroxylase/17,20 lyase-like [Haliotis rufescens]|uniref:steroid 17-alpha-hydroxylase/17,20 lyase-like n=1 Tax=Haliotis rufescens TaxID=6454 RepID=UPI00201F036E|nr:steroid 17-alpha-hydroxylase/17,20 lyase-like [Haliotis rufescens]XP_046337594.2 steroid 17-alpha-hydroxylase/17,20 lyase-like [Haliotis rufescens]XP_046337595.2 steroid 17-alpha-hydroxylase/17,20 lyase-like [Haliotis rufescens]XP_046337596.2 steroid 17-alpha-hydroxylase/17,20 lyase-like [Haliotis rufescens]XP_048254786.1 steroid 17-alpha-hydroxylase/17,20 lyase-like [Haliotis rufescens]